MRQDLRVISRIRLKLSLTRLVGAAVITLVAIAIWLYVTVQLRHFGSAIDYNFLHALGANVVGFLTVANPYVWWVVVLIWTLIVFAITRSALRSIRNTADARPLTVGTFDTLTSELSAPALDVLQWCWNPRDEPFTQGQLRLTAQAIRRGRGQLIDLAREQDMLLARARNNKVAMGIRSAPPTERTAAVQAAASSAHASPFAQQAQRGEEPSLRDRP